MPFERVKTEARKGSLSRPLKQSSHDSDKPQKKKGPEPAQVRPIASRGNSEKPKESSKGKIERLFDSLKVPVVPGPNGKMHCVNYKARSQGDTSSESDPSFYTDSSGGSDNGSARSAHQNGGEGGQSGDTASVVSGKSNHSMGPRRGVNTGNGSAEGVHAADLLPDSVHQDIDGGAQPVGDTASVTSRQSHKSTMSKHSANNGNGSTTSVHASNVHQNSGGPDQSRGDTASVTSRQSNKSTKTKRSVHSGTSDKSTKSEHSGHAGGVVHQDGGVGANDGIEGLGEEGHGGEADQGTEGQGQDGEEGDGANDVCGNEAGAKDVGGEDDAGEAHACAQGPPPAKNDDTKEGDASSKHREAKAHVAEAHPEDRNAGEVQGSAVEQDDGDGDGDGEKKHLPSHGDPRTDMTKELDDSYLRSLVFVAYSCAAILHYTTLHYVSYGGTRRNRDNK